MIKVNLLESVTDSTRGVVVVKQKVSHPAMQSVMMVLVVTMLLLAGIGYDYFSSGAARDKAQKDLEEQKRIAAQMAAVNKEQAELEKKSQEVQARIDAIQKLRSSQQGPVALLQELKARIDGVPGIYLENVQQKGEELVIKGNSPNEAAVTMFGRSLEFSSGLFTNLNIETQRKELPAPNIDTSAAPLAQGMQIEKPETVDFTIKCTYSPIKAAPPQGANTTAANQVAQK